MKYDFNYNINKKYLDKDSDAKYESDSFKDLISCMHIQIECMEKYADEGDEYLIQEEFVERVKPLAQAWTWEGGTWQEAFPVVMQSGIDTWETLKNDHGFDLQGVLRRRKLIPPVLVPRQVAEKEGDARKLSLLNNLREAQQAFIFGAPHAALAFLRSIVEAVLRDYYQAEGKNLAERITNTRGLPAKANKWALRYLRKLANAFLHTAPKSEGNVIDKDAAQFEEMNEKQKEIEMVRLFDIVRALIEGVPRERRQRQADGGVTEP